MAKINRKSPQVRGIAHVISLADRIIATVAIVFSADVQKYISSLLLNFFRQAFSMIIVIYFITEAKNIRKLSKKNICLMILDAALFSVYTFVMNMGTKLTGGAIAGIGTVSRNLFILAFGVLFKHEKFNLIKLASACLCTAAILVNVEYGKIGLNLGIFYVVLAQFMISISTTIQQHFLAYISPLCISFWRNSIALVFVTIMSAGSWGDFNSSEIPSKIYGQIFLMAISATLCKWTFDLWASGVLTAYIVASYTAFTPVLSILFDYIVNDAVFNTKIWISLALSTLGLIVLAIYTFVMNNDLGNRMTYDLLEEVEVAREQ